MKKPLNNCFSSALFQDPAAAGELGQRQHHSGGMCQHRGISGPLAAALQIRAWERQNLAMAVAVAGSRPRLSRLDGTRSWRYRWQQTSLWVPAGWLRRPSRWWHMDGLGGGGMDGLGGAVARQALIGHTSRLQ